MRKTILILLVASVMLVPAEIAMANGVSVGSLGSLGSLGSEELIKNSKQYDGMRIVYTGEVIGDVMKRGDYAWINVSDGDNAIGVWTNDPAINSLKYLGRYGVTGDTVRVEGVFHRACGEHGGDLDIHAASVVIVKAGSEAKAIVPVWKVVVTVVAVAALIVGGYPLLKKPD
jgi:hypothetical protein